MRWTWRLMIVGCLLLVTACSKGEETSSTQKLELEADKLTKLVIDNRNGEIEVSGADTDTIEVTAVVTTKGISMDKLKLKLRAEGAAAYLDASFGSQMLAMGSGAVDLVITLPRELAVEVDSHRDGKLKVADLSAPLEVDNVNGDLEVIDTKGPVTLSNRDGDITVRNIETDVNIHNINGHIAVTQVEGSVEAAVGDGSLELDHVTGDAVISQTGNGEIKLGAIGGNVSRK
ncbi:DUF4097 family beta strand repeat-containing protein [Paenibacillus riograndensis]|uniref:Putative secreted protein n=1 Tax=Paenibacillus riograndensis SBR5 TaxID=1073571 RepID=A0A0E3WJM1_9BACL|nr:DUF4097 family beta strand repeat-containing protein [Paenibacillus riograndensis]CQR59028.1 putative secreted protein [Paenibacillus riograndensis SBR5]